MKIMAERMKKLLDTYIIKYQAGFLLNKNIKDNLRTVIDLLKFGEMSPRRKISFYF